jgi:polar amino acid transport system substrate-binding protein
MRRLWTLAAAIAAIVILAGCGAALNRPERTTLAALALPTPPAPTHKPTPTVDCDPRTLTASLRPPATMPAAGAMPTGSLMATIRRRGYLKAGVDQNTLLFAYFNPLHRTIEGFEIDLLKQIAHAIFGNKPNDIQFKAITTDERTTDVQNGSVDIVADAMTVNCARKQLVDFSTIYYNAGQKILVPSNSAVRSVADLGGKKVCATTGSTSIATLATLTPRPVPYPVKQRTDCLVALQEGLVSAITSDDALLLGLRAQDPDTRIVGPVFAPDPYGMAMSKAHPEFVRFVNGVLAQMRQDGRWRALYKRWLGPYAKSIPAPPTASYDG